MVNISGVGVGGASTGPIAAAAAGTAVASALDANTTAAAAALFGALGLGTATDSLA